MTHVITDTAALTTFCESLASEAFITIDTEFLREKTYYAQLCLVQIAGEHNNAAIDPLAEGIDLTPLFTLLKNRKVLKVFHACRQDLEIFYQLMGDVTAPVFDTQIAVQVLGLGDNLSYENLIRKRLNRQIDKGQRFTDWSKRPLTEAQLTYAMGDVTHLRDAYLSIVAELQERGREGWIAEELLALEKPSLHAIAPEDAWQRIRMRGSKAQQYGILRQLAAWREDKAQSEDVPRGRIIRDEVLAELATNLPKTEAQMRKMRGFPAHIRSAWRDELWQLCAALPELPESEWLEVEKTARASAKTEGRMEMLRLLLKQVTRDSDVSGSFIAKRDELESFAANSYEGDQHPILQGWRYEVFGQKAQDLLAGKQAATLNPNTGDIVFTAL